MATASFCFYADLNFFLPPSRKQVCFSHSFEGRVSILDMIQALGVPHPEVEAILVNGKAVDFSYWVKDGDRIEVYPISASIPLTSGLSLRPSLPLEARFVLDVHLGKLANSLRMLGFDTLYRNDYADDELAQISDTQQRIVLTRDRGVVMRSRVVYGYYVRSTAPNRQVVEVLQRFDLFNSAKPFRRCLRCNGLNEPVAKELIVDRLPLKVRRDIVEFYRCSQCSQIYWKGSHYEQMQEFIQAVLDSGKNISS